MTESSNIARPYARAVFELAAQQKDLAGWSARLELLAAITAAADVVRLAGNPRVSAAQLEELILGVAADSLDSLNEQAVNLVKLLVRNGRIGVLPEIARAYAALRAEAENTVAAEIITAAEIDAAPARAIHRPLLQGETGAHGQTRLSRSTVNWSAVRWCAPATGS